MISIFSSPEVAKLHTTWQQQTNLYERLCPKAIHSVVNNPDAFFLLIHDPIDGIVGSCSLAPYAKETWRCFDFHVSTPDLDYLYVHIFQEITKMARTHGFKNLVVELSPQEQINFDHFSTWPFKKMVIQGDRKIYHIDLSFVALRTQRDEIIYLRA